MVNLIIYSDAPHQTIQSIRDAVASRADCRVCRVKTHQDFQRELTAALSGESLVIYFVNRPLDMVFLESVAASFMDIKMVICQTLEDDELMMKAYALSPRMVLNRWNIGAMLPHVVDSMVASIRKQHRIMAG